MRRDNVFRLAALGLTLCLALSVAGCASNPGQTPGVDPNVTLPSGRASPMPSPGLGTPGPGLTEMPITTEIKLPETLKIGDDKMPTLSVYVVDKKQLQDMPLETYLQGVLAGEMKNDWPLEALKAQAILARTFVLKFISEKQSKYPGAQVSTDIEEAQAYDAAGINDRIKQAVKETEGLVLSAQGEIPYAWFHAHSGGITALAKEGLEYEYDEPPYTHIVKGMENDQAPKDDVEWTASFTASEVMKAANQVGATGDRLSSISLGQHGPSERITTLTINGKSVPAGSFRIAIGSTKLKSTLLESVKLSEGKVTFTGRGYGHGVGMSQWGAYALAEQGQKADQIVTYYFNGVQVVKLW